MDMFRRFFGFPPSDSFPYHLDENFYADDRHQNDADNWSSGGECPFDRGVFTPGANSADVNEDMMQAMSQMAQLMTMMDQLFVGSQQGDNTFFSPGLLAPDNRGQDGQQQQQPFSFFFSHPSLEAPPTNPRDALLKQPDCLLPQLPNSPIDLPQLYPEHESTNNNPLDALETKTPSHRDLLVKKEDGDLDQSAYASLLKDGPGYSYDNNKIIPRPPANDGMTSSQELLSPSVTRSYTSTSISRIVKPDGSVEEKRTYRDSSGREEVTVTHIDGSEDGAQRHPVMGPGGPSFGPGEPALDPFVSGVLGSIFSAFFR